MKFLNNFTVNIENIAKQVYPSKNLEYKKEKKYAFVFKLFVLREADQRYRS